MGDPCNLMTLKKREFNSFSLSLQITRITRFCNGSRTGSHGSRMQCALGEPSPLSVSEGAMQTVRRGLAGPLPVCACSTLRSHVGYAGMSAALWLKHRRRLCPCLLSGRDPRHGLRAAASQAPPHGPQATTSGSRGAAARLIHACRTRSFRLTRNG